MTNTYSITTAQPEVTKQVEGDLNAPNYNKDEEFTFTLAADDEDTPMPADGGDTVAVKAGKTGVFGKITYTEEGTYSYTVTETEGATKGMTYDTGARKVTVTVTRDEGTGALTAAVEYDGKDSLTVTNTFKTGKLKVVKTVDGLPADIAGDVIYLVSVKDAEGNYYAMNGASVGTTEHWVEIRSGEEKAALWQYLTVGETYTVTEKVELAEVTGYKLASTTYKVGEAEGQSAGIIADETVTVTVTNTYGQELTEASVRKEWNDNDDAEGHRPERLSLTLKADGEKAVNDKGEDVSSVTLDAEGDWKAKVENLPKFNDKGVEISYTWEEDTTSLPEGYSLTGTAVEGTVTTLTNTYAPGKTSEKVTKVWNDNGDQDGKRPTSVFVLLSATAEGAEVALDRADLICELKADGNWTYIWTELDEEMSDGKQITYAVTEVQDESGTAIEDGKIVFDGTEYTVAVTGDAENGFTVTNSYTPDTVEVPVTKVWDDRNDADGVRPKEITVILYADGKPISEAVLKTDDESVNASTDENGDDTWSYTFKNLQKYDGGEEIAYTVKEYTAIDLTDAYTYVGTEGSAAKGYVITNKHVPTTEIAVTKAWDDDGDAAGKRPASVTVNLMNGDTKVDSAILSEANGWEAAFADLPVYEEAEDGTRTDIIYTVTEDGASEGKISFNGAEYTVEITNDDEGSFTVTNTYHEVSVQPEVTKTVTGDTDDPAYDADEVFTFILKDSEGNELGSAGVKAGETGVFDAITYTAAGEYEYTITEQQGDTFGMTYDTGDKKVLVTVVSDEKGALSATVTYDGEEALEVENTFTFERVTVSADKHWFNADGTDIDSTVENVTVTFTLQRSTDGSNWTDAETKEANPQTVRAKNADGAWKAEWTELPKYDLVNGEKTGIGYRVVETSATIAGEDITPETGAEKIVEIDESGKGSAAFENTLPAIEIPVVKVWDGTGTQEGDYVTFGLFIGDEAVTDGGKEATLTFEHDTWSEPQSFTGLNKYDDEGSAITYTVKEIAARLGDTEAVDAEAAKALFGNKDIDVLSTGEIGVQTVTNTIRAKLSVTKTVSVTGADGEADEDSALLDRLFLVAVRDENGSFYALNGAVAGKDEHWVEIKNGDTLTWEELPLGTYSVVEKEDIADVAGYGRTTIVEPETVTLTAENKDKAAELSVTNEYVRKTTLVQVAKIWLDSEGNTATANLPENLTVALKAGGKQARDAEGEDITVTLNDENGWTSEKIAVPAYDDEGQKIAYTWSEDRSGLAEGWSLTNVAVTDLTEGEGGQAAVTGQLTTLTNSFKQDVTSLKVLKVWDDADNQDGYRPTVKVQLYKQIGDAEAVKVGDAVELTSANGWIKVFEDLPLKENGENVSYSVREVIGDKEYVDGDEVQVKEGNDEAVYTVSIAVDGAEVTITNAHETEKTEVPVRKLWDDADDQDGVRPEQITVILYADQKPVAEKVLTEKDKDDTIGEPWSYTFRDLDKYANKTEITYSVKEFMDVELNLYYEQVGTPAQNEDGVWEITNRHEPEKVTVEITKVWDDGDDRDGLRLSAEDFADAVSLYAGDVSVESELEEGQKTVTDNGDGTYTVTYAGLDRYESGEEIAYSVHEDLTVIEAKGYEAEPADGVAQNGGTLVNRHEPLTTEVEITKTWADEEDVDGLRPTRDEYAAMVHLFAGDAEVTGAAPDVTDNGDGTYTVRWTNLPVYEQKTADGKTTTEEIEYKVTEDAVEGYEAEPESGEVELTGYKGEITNTHTPETVTVEGEKKWVGDERFAGILRPDHVTVTLFADGKEADTRTVEPDEAGKWSFRFEDLPKNRKDGGKTAEIVYTVEETIEPDAIAALYTSCVDGTTVTNTLNTGMLKLYKAFRINGAPLSEDDLKKLDALEFTVTVTLDGKTYYVGKASGSNAGTLNEEETVFTYADFADGYLVIDDLPIGEYTVRENGADELLSDIHYALTSAAVDGAEGTRTTVTVEKDAFTKVHFVNTYEQELGQLKVKKALKGDGIDDNKTFRLAVYSLSDGGEKTYFATNGSAVTGDNKWVEFRADETKTWLNLPVGTYFVEEDEADAGVENYALEVSYSDEDGVEVAKLKDGESASETTVTNTYTQDKGTLTVKKTVTVIGGEIEERTWKIGVMDADGTFYTVAGKPAEEGSEYVSFEQDQTITWSDLPVGTYTVVEDQNDAAIDGFALTVTGEGEVTVEKADGSQSGEAGADATIDNKYTREVGSLTVTKQVVAPEGADLSAMTYALAVVSGEEGSYIYYNTDGTAAEGEVWVELKANESATWSDLPIGSYTVLENTEEAEAQGFTLTVTDDGKVSVTVAQDEETRATVVNSYNQDVGSLTIAKNFDFGDDEEPADIELAGLKFTVKGENGYEQTIYYAQFEDGKYTVGNLPVGDYTVTESNGDELLAAIGYSLVKSESDPGDGLATVVKGETVTVEFTNTYEQDRGSLKLKKTFEGVPEDADLNALTFSVKGIDYDKEFTYAEFDGNGELLIEDLPVGLYVVTESNAEGLIADYALIASESITSGSAEVKKDEVSEVRLVNKYEQQLGKLTIVKNFKGIPADADVTALSFTVTDSEGNVVAEVTYDAFTNGVYTVENLAVGTYTVAETNAEGLLLNYALAASAVTEADVEVKAGESALVTLMNEYTPVTTKVEVTKEWDDDDNNDGKRPGSVTVVLLADGEEIDSAILSDENGWKAAFEDLAVYSAEDTEIVYTLDELKVEGYETEIGALEGDAEEGYTVTVTNTHENELTETTVVKVWDDADNRDGNRPASVTMKLYANNGDTGIRVSLADKAADQTKTASEKETFKDAMFDLSTALTAVVSELPAYIDGVKQTYTWIEDLESLSKVGYTISAIELTDEGRTVTVTNTYDTERFCLAVVKVWNDDNNSAGFRPASINAGLYKKTASGYVAVRDGDGKEISFTLSDANSWTALATGLAIRENGEAIKYFWKETSTDGNIDKYASETDSEGYISANESTTRVGEIKNTYAPETVELSVRKAWDDADDKDHVRPDHVDVKLLADGKEYRIFRLSEANGWTAKAEKLNKYAGGKEIVYTWEEFEVPVGYETTVGEADEDGVTVITNTHEPETTQARVTKVWDDADDQDGLRPDSVTMKLLADNAETGIEVMLGAGEASGADKVKVSFSEDKLSATVSELPVYNENGKVITYSWAEVIPEGYSISAYETVETDGVVETSITNTVTPDRMCLAVYKIWDDDDDRDGLRPESISLTLLANGDEAVYTDGAKVGKIELGDDNNWSALVIGLPIMADGEEIEYEWVEGAFDNDDQYTLTVGTDKTGRVTYLTNAHKTKETEISVRKIWDDANDQDGLRPDSVTVYLLADETPVSKATLSVDNEWSYTFEHLPVFSEGKEIVYSVDEIEVPGYATVINEESGAEGAEYEIVNRHEPETVLLSVVKVWDDDENRDGARPDELTVVLSANKEAILNVSLNEGNSWTETTDALPRYEKGEKIAYTWEEYDLPEGYTLTSTETEEGVNGEITTLTNRYEPELTKLSVTKVWEDDDDQDGKRPGSITVILYADDEEIDTAVLSAQNGWKFVFDDLNVYRDQGKEIVYSLSEVEVDGYETEVEMTGDAGKGYTVTVTNTHEIEKTAVEVEKFWEDADNQDGTRPERVTMTLYKNNKPTETRVELTEKNGWYAKVENLDKYEDGDEIVYFFMEEAVENYSVTGYAIEDNKTSVTNAYTPERFCLTVVKVWEDDNDRDGLRPDSVTVRLLANGEVAKYADGTAVEDVELNEGNHFTGMVTGLPIKADGKAIVYSWQEVKVPEGYESDSPVTVDDSRIAVITNTHESELTEIAVKKVWDDDEDRDGLRPEAVTVELLADGVPTAEAALNESTTWSYTFEELPVKSEGKEISYTVREIDVPAGYTVTVSGDAEKGFTVTNAHESEKIEVSVAKVWDDADDQDGKRPDSLALTLLADGEATETVVTLTKSNDYKATVRDLYKYAEGKEIAYTWDETNVPDGYELVSNETVGALTVVTNRHAPEETELSVVKVWDDEKHTDKRPESIEVLLKADGNTVLSATLNDANSWTAKAGNLPVYKDGKRIAYNWEEAAVPAGYTMTLEVKDGVTTITNTFVTAKLVITKTFEGIPEGADVKGLQFTVTGPDYEETITYSDFDKDNRYVIEDLVPGRYNVVEENAFDLIDNYTLDIENSTITASALVIGGEEGRLELKNVYTEDKGKLQIVKAFCGVPKDDAPWDEEALSKLSFRVRGKDSGYDETFAYADFSDTVALDGNLTKMLVIEDLAIDTYTVTETGAEGILSGYTLQASSVKEGSAAVVKDAEVSVVLKNNYKKDTASLVIEKSFVITDAEGNKVDADSFNLSALSFKVTGSDLNNDEEYEETFYYAQFTDGKLTIENLTPGTYTVTETNAGELIANYTLTATTNDGPATIAKDETGEIKLTNTYAQDKGSIKVTKTVSGAPETESDKAYSFTVRDAAGKYITAQGNISDSKVVLSVKAGQSLTIDNLPIGRYTVSELRDSAVISNYTLTEASVTEGEAEVEIGKEAEVTLSNVYERDEGSVKVTKLAIGAPEGTAFRIALTDADGSYMTQKGEASEEEVWVTLKSGETAEWSDLPVGTYTVVEDDAELDGLTLTVTGTGEVEVVRNAQTGVTVVNNYTDDLGKLTITKTFTGLSEDADTAHLAFEITGPHGYSQTIYYIQFTDGKYTIENLPVGEYEVRETNAETLINAYTLLASTTEGSGEVTRDGEATVKLENNYEQDLGELVIRKSFAGIPEDADVSKLGFEVTGPGDYSLSLTYADFEADGTYTIRDLPVGIYSVSEIGAEGLIDHYILSSGSVTGGKADVTVNGTVTIELSNEYEPNLGKLTIRKLFAGQPKDADVSGLTFEITGPEDYSLTVRYGDFTDGSYTISDLPEGVYRVKEINAEGLVADYNLLTISVTEGEASVAANETATIRLINLYEVKKGSLTIRKTFSGQPEDAALDGLNFLITGPDGFNLNVSYAAFEGGAFTIDNLPVGEYTVTETNAEGLFVNYTLTDSVVSATAKVEENATATVELINNYELNLGKLQITKVFSGLTGDDNVDHLVFRVIGPDGFDESVTYGEFTDGVYVFEDLVPGQYLVYEPNAAFLAFNLLLREDSVTVANVMVKKDETAEVTLTNNYDNANTELFIMKLWDDKDDLDGSRPEAVIVTLNNGAQVIATVELNAANDWTASVVVPMGDGEGNAINYTWHEETVTGYVLTSQRELGNATVLTNTHEPELVSTTVRKVWRDNDNRAKLRPTVLLVTLSNGTSYALSEANNWTVTVDNLPKYFKGEEIRYTWSEQTVLGYKQTGVAVDGDTTTFTNTYTLPPTPGTPPVPIDEYGTPLGIDVIINHVGDCFD